MKSEIKNTIEILEREQFIIEELTKIKSDREELEFYKNINSLLMTTIDDIKQKIKKLK